MRIRTQRLTLVSFTLEMWEGLCRSHYDVRELMGYAAEEGWPTQDILDAASYFVQYFQEHPAMIDRMCWFIVEKQSHRIIGDLGFKAEPDLQGAVEIGYGIVPSRQQNGFAVEATTALVEWAFSLPDIRIITAQCMNENIPSVKTLQKIGMKPLYQSEGVTFWEIKKRAFTQVVVS